MAAKKKTKEILTPEVSIGMVGHVDHGKTTLVKALSGKWTDTHSEELKKGITIRLGYADTTFVKTKDKKLTTEIMAKEEKSDYDVLRRVSFVDAPGHESLMATMLSGATLMDGALLLVSANEKCPQPQTREHLMALSMSGMKNVIVIQNKIDIVDEKRALENYNEIKEFLKDTEYKDAPIIPISAQQGINLDILIETIEEYIPTPKRDLTKDPIMLVARSFDINKPGSEAHNLVGGVLGGALKQGKLKVGQEIEIKPGRMVEERNQKIWKPIKTKITAIKYANDDVEEVSPGGTFGVLTALDPALVKSDSLGGSMIGIPDKLPPTLMQVKLQIHLMDRVVGAMGDIDVIPVKKHEMLMMNVNSSSTVGIVTELKKDSAEFSLKLPICANPGDKITLSRRIGDRFRLIGYGIIE